MGIELDTAAQILRLPADKFSALQEALSHWFNGRWSSLQLPLSIAYKELFPVVLAAHVWGPGWSRRRIMFHVDNKAVHILNSRTSPDTNIMHLLHSLLKAAACFSFTFTAIHVPVRNNGIADALSYFNC